MVDDFADEAYSPGLFALVATKNEDAALIDQFTALSPCSCGSLGWNRSVLGKFCSIPAGAASRRAREL
jgi:hypothetical protein